MTLASTHFLCLERIETPSHCRKYQPSHSPKRYVQKIGWAKRFLDGAEHGSNGRVSHPSCFPFVVDTCLRGSSPRCSDWVPCSCGRNSAHGRNSSPTRTLWQEHSLQTRPSQPDRNNTCPLWTFLLTFPDRNGIRYPPNINTTHIPEHAPTIIQQLILPRSTTISKFCTSTLFIPQLNFSLSQLPLRCPPHAQQKIRRRRSILQLVAQALNTAAEQATTSLSSQALARCVSVQEAAMTTVTTVRTQTTEEESDWCLSLKLRALITARKTTVTTVRTRTTEEESA